MNYLYYDLGLINSDKKVKVQLQGTACNVLLLDSINYSKFKAGQAYSYYGGRVTTSVITLPIPRYAHWYLVVYNGQARVSVTVI